MRRFFISILLAVGALSPAVLCASETLPWHTQWNSTLFTEAARQHRFVLLDLHAVWCHWCHVMDDTTYRDPEVQKLLRQHYVIVSVDADSDPELSARYGNWGWPATIVLAADGTEIVKRRGYMQAEQFTSLLKAIVADPSPGPSVDTPPAFVRISSSQLSTTARHSLTKVVDGAYDDANGGWGDLHKFVDASTLELSYLALDAGDQYAGRRARQTLDASLNLIDPIAGGVYQYSDTVDWNSPHFEKLMSFQADDLRLYSEAYARWADPRYLTAAESLYTYIATVLTAPDGGFYANQDADVSNTVSGHEYYPRDRAGRLALGSPRIDAHEYTRETAWAIRALCKYYDVTGKREALIRAEQAAHWALSQRARGIGGFRHGAVDRGGPFLDDSLAMTRAFLSLYQSTAERSWLESAEATLDFIEKHLRNSTSGYDSASPVRNGTGVFATAFRTPEHNADVVLAANLAYRYTGRQNYRLMSQHAMQFLIVVTLSEPNRFHPEILLADRESAVAPIHITVVGPKSDSAAQALHTAALRYPADYLQVEWWDPAEGKPLGQHIQYPVLDRAAAFACTATACSLPIFDAGDIAPTVNRSLMN